MPNYHYICDNLNLVRFPNREGYITSLKGLVHSNIVSTLTNMNSRMERTIYRLL